MRYISPALPHPPDPPKNTPLSGRPGLQFPARARPISSRKCPNRLWGPTSVLPNVLFLGVKRPEFETKALWIDKFRDPICNSSDELRYILTCRSLSNSSRHKAKYLPEFSLLDIHVKSAKVTMCFEHRALDCYCLASCNRVQQYQTVLYYSCLEL
jgi:hypothetical protein